MKAKKQGGIVMKGKESKAQILWKLFKATFMLSAFTFGGGFVIVYFAYMQDKRV